MSTQLNLSDQNRGYSPSIVGWGDSLTAGTGGTRSYLQWLSDLLANRVMTNQGIGGQTFQQIAPRQGSAPALLTLSGNAFNGTAAVPVTLASPQLLSTPADNNTRVVSGLLAGVPCYLTRTASGGPPSTTETYTVTPFLTSAVAVPANTPFYPDDGLNARHQIQLLWLGRNNTPTFVGLSDAIDACIGYMGTPRRNLVLGVLNALNETIGGANYSAIVAQNADAAARWPTQFVAMTPPTAEEMATLSYTPTTQDNTDITNGTIPTGMRFDNVHLNDVGYRLIALRCFRKIAALNW